MISVHGSLFEEMEEILDTILIVSRYMAQLLRFTLLVSNQQQRQWNREQSGININFSNTHFQQIRSQIDENFDEQNTNEFELYNEEIDLEESEEENDGKEETGHKIEMEENIDSTVEAIERR